MLDGPQGLARAPATMRACERLTGAPGKTPHQRPAFYVPFAGFIHSSVELFAALHTAGILISPVAGQQGCGEVYPGDMWTALVPRLPKKGTPEGDRLRSAMLGLLGVTRLPPNVTHDQNDAAIAAVAAAALDGVVPGVAAQLVGDALHIDKGGILREGPMVRLSLTSADLRHTPGQSHPAGFGRIGPRSGLPRCCRLRAPVAHDSLGLLEGNRPARPVRGGRECGPTGHREGILARSDLRLSEEVVRHRLPQAPGDRDWTTSLVRHVVCGAEARVRGRSARFVLPMSDEQKDVATVAWW